MLDNECILYVIKHQQFSRHRKKKKKTLSQDISSYILIVFEDITQMCLTFRTLFPYLSEK